MSQVGDKNKIQFRSKIPSHVTELRCTLQMWTSVGTCLVFVRMENVLTMMEAIVVNAKWDISLTQLARSAWVSDIVPDMLRVNLFG